MPLTDDTDRCDCGRPLRNREQRGLGMCGDCMADAMWDTRCRCGTDLDSPGTRRAGLCDECAQSELDEQALAIERDER